MHINLVDLFKELLEANGLGFFGFHFPAFRHARRFLQSGLESYFWLLWLLFVKEFCHFDEGEITSY